MGQSTDGILAFGWDLGSVEDRDEDHWAFDLLERISSHEEDMDDVYVAASGVTLPPNPWDDVFRDHESDWFYEPFRPGEFTRRETPEYAAWSEQTKEARVEYRRAKQAAIDSVDFELIDHCSCDYKMHILTLRDTYWSASRGSPIDVGEVLKWPRDAYVSRLYDAARLLDLEPPEPPKLLLASMWC